MESGRFYYSTDGTDAHGPVTEDELRQLYQDQLIGATSYLCREGESEWLRLEPKLFGPRQIEPPRPPPYEPPPLVITPEMEERMQMPPEYTLWEGGLGSTIFNSVWIVLALGGSVGLTVMTPAPRADEAEMIGYHAGTFTADLVFLGVIPFLISKLGGGLIRLLIRTILTIAFAALLVVLKMHGSAAKLEAEANAMSDQTKAEARKQIAEKGYYDGSIQQAEVNMQKLSDQANQDNSESSRLMRAAMGVSQEIIAKVKVSADAEKACGSFDPVTLNSLDDITRLRDAITKLRVTQVDVLSEFQNYDDRCRAALAGGNFSANSINEFVEGAHKGGHIDQVVVIWQTKIKLTDDHLVRLDFLAKNWGAWNVKDGKLLFSDDANLQTYNSLTEQLQSDVKRIGDLQKQIFQ